MRHGLIVVGLVAGGCFTDPPTAGGSGSMATTSGDTTSASSIGSGTATADAASSSEDSSTGPSSSSASSTTTTTPCDDGDVDCPCFPNETCTAGLVCLGDTCVPQLCGNGAPDPGEDCDDGNPAPGDGCAADCTYETQCFVGNFGGENTIQLATFSVDRTGALRHIATETTVGTLQPPQSFSDETSLSGLRRFVYLANDETVESFEIGLDGTFPSTSTDLQIAGLLGLAGDRRLPWLLAASDNGTFAVHRIEADPSGANPALEDSLEVPLSNGSSAVLMDFHPQLNTAYIVVEPANFSDNVQVITLEFNVAGDLGEAHAETLTNVGFVRGMRAVELPSRLLLTGTFYSNDGDGCFGRIDLLDNGRLSGVQPDANCMSPWGGYVGILQANPAGPVIFGTTAPRIAEWGGDVDPVNTVQTTGARHFLRQPWPDMLLVASDSQLLAVGLDSRGSTTRILDTALLEPEGLTPRGGVANQWFQAGVMVPCPTAP